MNVFGIQRCRVSIEWLQQPGRSLALPENGLQSGSDEQRSQLLPQSQRTARRHASGRFAMPRSNQFAGDPTGVIATGIVVTNRGGYRRDYEAYSG